LGRGAVRVVQALPPAVVGIAIRGIEEGPELGIGDRVAGDPEELGSAAHAILVEEVPARDLHPVDIRQAVRSQAHALAVVEAEPAQGTADGRTCLGLRVVLQVGEPRQKGLVQLREQALPAGDPGAALQDALGGDLGQGGCQLGQPLVEEAVQIHVPGPVAQAHQQG